MLILLEFCSCLEINSYSLDIDLGVVVFMKFVEVNEDRIVVQVIISEPEKIQCVDFALLLVFVEVIAAPLEVIQIYLNSSAIVGSILKFHVRVRDESYFGKIKIGTRVQFTDL